MSNLKIVREDWMKRIEESGHQFIPDDLGPGCFCMYIVDYGIGPMCGGGGSSMTATYKDLRTALGYLRFFLIPYILDWDSETHTPDLNFLRAEEYLDCYEADKRKEIGDVIALFDRVIDADEITDKMLNELLQAFNNVFGSTSPSQEITAWGSLTQYLKDPYFHEAFEDAIGEEKDDFGEDVTDIMDVEVCPMMFLKHLLDEGQFDENNPEHIELAKEFLEQQECY